MIHSSYKQVHSQEWVTQHIIDPAHELVILRQVIPWQKIINSLVCCYSPNRGRFGCNLRILVSVLILGKLYQSGDSAVIKLIKENRYCQYFCNVADQGLNTFLDRSTLIRFRKRIGAKGTALIENHIFQHLRRSGAIGNDAALIDSSVLESNIIHPNDVLLIYKAFGRLEQWADQFNVLVWWNKESVKKEWYGFNKAKKGKRLEFLNVFHELFEPALQGFIAITNTIKDGHQKKQLNTGSKY